MIDGWQARGGSPPATGGSPVRVRAVGLQMEQTNYFGDGRQVESGGRVL
jgi:hypothetical protein